MARVNHKLVKQRLKRKNAALLQTGSSSLPVFLQDILKTLQRHKQNGINTIAVSASTCIGTRKTAALPAQITSLSA